jgi:hypothetical protein
VTREQFSTLLAACGSDLEGMRDAALLVVLAHGFTAEEAVKLRMGDIQPGDTGALRVMSLDRSVVIADPRHMAILEAWIAARSAAGLPRDEGPVVVLVHFSRRGAMQTKGTPAQAWLVDMVHQRCVRDAGLSPSPTVDDVRAVFAPSEAS